MPTNLHDAKYVCVIGREQSPCMFSDAEYAGVFHLIYLFYC